MNRLTKPVYIYCVGMYETDTFVACIVNVRPETKIYKDYCNFWILFTTVKNWQLLISKLTAHNWQKWKRVFLTCPCHKIYRGEAVGLKICKYTWKITIYVNMWNLGQFCEILIFFNNCLIEAQIWKILLHMCDTYNCNYLKHSTFRFNLIDFQLHTDFPSQYCIFYRKIT